MSWAEHIFLFFDLILIVIRDEVAAYHQPRFSDAASVHHLLFTDEVMDMIQSTALKTCDGITGGAAIEHQQTS